MQSHRDLRSKQGEDTLMKTPIAIIQETRRAAMVVGAMADMIADKIEFSLILHEDRSKLDAVWSTLHDLHNELKNSACAMEEENLNLQNQ